MGFITLNCKAKGAHPPSHFQGLPQRLENNENATAGKPFCFIFAKAKKTNICVNDKLKRFKDIRKISENLT